MENDPGQLTNVAENSPDVVRNLMSSDLRRIKLQAAHVGFVKLERIQITTHMPTQHNRLPFNNFIHHCFNGQSCNFHTQQLILKLSAIGLLCLFPMSAVMGQLTTESFDKLVLRSVISTEVNDLEGRSEWLIGRLDFEQEKNLLIEVETWHKRHFNLKTPSWWRREKLTFVLNFDAQNIAVSMQNLKVPFKQIWSVGEFDDRSAVGITERQQLATLFRQEGRYRIELKALDNESTKTGQTQQPKNQQLPASTDEKSKTKETLQILDFQTPDQAVLNGYDMLDEWKWQTLDLDRLPFQSSDVLKHEPVLVSGAYGEKIRSVGCFDFSKKLKILAVNGNHFEIPIGEALTNEIVNVNAMLFGIPESDRFFEPIPKSDHPRSSSRASEKGADYLDRFVIRKWLYEGMLRCSSRGEFLIYRSVQGAGLNVIDSKGAEFQVPDCANVVQFELIDWNQHLIVMTSEWHEDRIQFRLYCLDDLAKIKMIGTWAKTQEVETDFEKARTLPDGMIKFVPIGHSDQLFAILIKNFTRRGEVVKSEAGDYVVPRAKAINLGELIRANL